MKGRQNRMKKVSKEKAIAAVLVFLTPFLQGQNNNLEDIRLYHDVYSPTQVIDSVYGIVMYEKLNPYLGGDSIRHCKGYACTGFVEDYYENGQLLHKGFYAEGKLKFYKNYYPNGNVERDFRAMDDIRQKLKLYYPSGILKSDLEYRSGKPVKWQDFYENGQPEYYEEYDKTGEYYLVKKQWYADGKIQLEMTMMDKKNLEYVHTEYYPNGNIRAQGTLRFSTNTYDYVRTGTWKYFDEQGNLKKEETYASGKVVSTKQY